jgi:SAM-dependent methyltransferase
MNMHDEHGQAIADHWAKGDVYGLILSALERAGKSPESLSVEELAPIDHFHARGFPATVNLADRLPVKPDHHILDIGCGLGGPARYFATRFHCRVTGIDITPAFVDAARKLTALLDLQGQVTVDDGDGHSLPYADEVFDGAYTQHVTMNVADRARFFGEAFRVLKSGGYFALTEHGLGPTGNPHHPVPWSSDGSGAYLIPPSETRAFLEAAGFTEVVVEDTGDKYLAAYKSLMASSAQGDVPPLSTQILMGENAAEKTRNAASNIEEGRTHPVEMLCRKP